MKKIVLILFASCLIIGCVSSNPNVSKLNTLEPGITKTELSAYLDGKTPISTDFIDGYYLVKYSLYDSHDIGTRPYYFVFDQRNNLVGWEELKGQNKIIVAGVTIAIPFPSRQ